MEALRDSASITASLPAGKAVAHAMARVNNPGGCWDAPPYPRFSSIPGRTSADKGKHQLRLAGCRGQDGFPRLFPPFFSIEVYDEFLMGESGGRIVVPAG